jgi:hypothetical protein
MMHLDLLGLPLKGPGVYLPEKGERGTETRIVGVHQHVWFVLLDRADRDQDHWIEREDAFHFLPTQPSKLDSPAFRHVASLSLSPAAFVTTDTPTTLTRTRSRV